MARRERPAGGRVAERPVAWRRTHVPGVHRPAPARCAGRRHPERSPGAGAADRLPRRSAVNGGACRAPRAQCADNKKTRQPGLPGFAASALEGARAGDLGIAVDQRRLVALVAEATAFSASAWALTVAASSWVLARSAIASLVLTVAPRTSWPTPMLRSTFSRATCTPFGNRVFRPSRSRTSAAWPKNEKVAS